MVLSERVKQLQPSPTLAITAKAAELRAAGKDIIGLGAGEPDFDTPEHIKDGAIKAIHNGETKYTPVDGTKRLKQAAIDKFRRDNKLEYELDQILVSCGGKQTSFNLCQAILNPGDEAVILAPYWVSYPAMVEIAGGKPVVIKTRVENRFKVEPAELDAAITDKTKLVFLNSPSNPTGVAYTRAELEAIGEVLRKYPDVMIATDDMYEHILWADEPFTNIVNACPDLYDRTLVMNGVSKAYAMTGWRIGYAGGPANVIKAMKKIQSQSTSGAASISQAAAATALESDQGCVAQMREAFRERYNFVYQRLSEMPGITPIEADGTFYSFPDCREAIEKLGMKDDMEFTEYLLDKAGIAVVPGTAFGMPGHIRLSFATSMDNLKKALDRLAKALA